MQELTIQLRASQEHDIVCRVEDIRPNDNIATPAVEVLLRPISDESLPVMKNDSLFFCLKENGEPFYLSYGFEYLDFEGQDRSDFDDLDKQCAWLKKLLNKKLVIIKPYYKRNDIRGYIYKKSNSMQGLSGLVDDIEPKFTFITIPHISDEQFDVLFRQKSAIKLRNWDTSIFGIPSYLDVGNRLVMANFVSSTNDNTIQWAGDDMLVCNFKSNPLETAGKIISDDTSKDYRFFAAQAVVDLIAQAKKEKEAKEQAEATDNTVVPALEEPEETDDTPMVEPDEELLNNLWNHMRASKLEYNQDDINNFHSCIKSGVLTILAGMSGTGKTRLPLEYADFFHMTEKDGTLLFLPISPSYTEPSDILGFYNPADKSFLPSEAGLTDFLVHASENPGKMHMVIFEEMNLAQIEHWFAPFLSIMEKDVSDRELRLYSSNIECRNKDKYPPVIHIGTNVIFVGTINIDETTTNLSDRLLDRSFVLNLEKLSLTCISNMSSSGSKKGVSSTYTPEDLWKQMGDRHRDFVDFDFAREFDPRQISFLDDLHKVLNESDANHGVSFRCAKNIAIYLHCCTFTDSFTSKRAFDYAIKQTVMKKIRGTVEALLSLVGENGGSDGALLELFDRYNDVSDFDLCRKELADKRRVLSKYGFVR